MTTNQMIDGVPRALLESLLTLAAMSASAPYRELRALLDADPAPCAKSQVEGKRERFQKWVMATKHPVFGFLDGRSLARGDDRTGYADEYVQGLWVAYLEFGAEQPAPVAMVPDGYCIMPRQLTAENGAKALLLGEFKLLVTKECPECYELEEPTEGCSICDGEGEYGQKHTIPWDQIKYIYSEAVSGLAVKAESAKSR